jgi:hypothetical protein
MRRDAIDNGCYLQVVFAGGDGPAAEQSLSTDRYCHQGQVGVSSNVTLLMIYG